jgi:small conductance mechanosensitive channel
MKKISILILIFTLNLAVFAAEASEIPADATGSQPQTVSEAVETVKTYLAENGMTFLINLLAAAAIFYIGRWIAKLISDLVFKAMDKAKIDHTLGRFVKNLLYTGLLVFVVIAALSRLGVQTGSFIAVIGAAGLAIGLALQGSLSNFAAGVLMVIFKPFKVGDFVEIGGATGTVVEIQIFNTIICGPDNVRIIIPNAHVTGGNIINYSVNGTRRVDLVIGVSYGDDISKAKDIMMNVLKSHELVLDAPEPVVAVKELADSSVDYVVRPWCKAEDYWTVYFDVTEKVKLALEANGLTIPFPQHDVHLYKTDSVV